MADPVIVPVGRCRCPTGLHGGGDTVSLRPSLTNAMAVAAAAVLRRLDNPEIVQGLLTEVWLHLGIIGWTFVEADGEGFRPVEISPANIERLVPWSAGGLALAQKADELYPEEFFRPLAVLRSTSSPATPTASSTSATPDSGPMPPARSRRSSPADSDGRLSGVPVP